MSKEYPRFGGSCSSSLSCLARIIFGVFLGEEKYRSKGKYLKEFKCKTPFKFFIVEEVMSSSLIAFNWMNLNLPEKGKVISFPLIQKFLKSFKLHSSFTHSIKQTNNLIIILTFQNLGCYKPTTLKMNLVLEIRRG